MASDIVASAATAEGRLELIKNGKLKDLVGEVANSDLNTAAAAVKACIEVAKDQDTCPELFRQEVGAQTLLSNAKEVVRVRAIDMFVDIGNIAPEYFQECVKIGVFDNSLNDLKSRDVLLQAVSLEIFGKVAVTPWGVAYLDHNGAFSLLLELLENPMTTTTVLSLFGNFFTAAFKVDEIFTSMQNAKITNVVMTVLEKEEQGEIREAAYQAAVAMACHPQGLHLLLQHGPALEAFTYQSCASSMTVRSRTVGLRGLAAVFNSERNRESAEILLRQLFEGVPNINSILTRYMKSPEQDLRNAAFSVVDAVAELSFGAPALLNIGGFVEFITDRRTETSHEGHEWKYAIVQKVVRSGVLSTSFSHFETALTQFEKEGVYYSQMQAQTMVATE